MDTPLVVGFDLRVPLSDPADDWSEERGPGWSSLEQLVPHAARAGYGSHNATLIAIAIVESGEESLPYGVPVAPRPAPGAPVDLAWPRLGRDVADGWQTSALSNCCPRPEPDRAGQFESDVNDHGLFDSLEIAHAFRRLSDARVPDHEPFFVYGLFLVPFEPVERGRSSEGGRAPGAGPGEGRMP